MCRAAEISSAPEQCGTSLPQRIPQFRINPPPPTHLHPPPPQVLKRAAVQTDPAVAAAHLLQLEALSGPLDAFIDARKRVASVSLSAHALAAPLTKTAVAAAAKGGKKGDDDAAPAAKRPRVTSEAAESSTATQTFTTAGATRKDGHAAAGAGGGGGGEELTLHVRHAFEIREVALRKL